MINEREEKNLSIASIECQETFESVPHSWEEKSTEIVGVKNKIVNYQWRKGEMNTKLHLKQNSK
jgi:hypothetical protein